ncbi:septation protein SepH [Pseudokineococcus sp. 1T1Z-3]|uniref:septation protein SepH n=1 Tax=Pseudokineococcus sp. 1T1Z-3 TaxID=3132745 RepID=UPI00309FD908
MQDLRLVGVHDDGEHLVLAGADGTRFRLPADDALRLAARRTTATSAGVTEQAPLTPREIQARLRAGEDADAIASATGTSVERVRRFEAPVLAERAHVAARARALPVRWRDGSGRSPALEDLAGERLGERGVQGEPGWDAWRREDGAWLVEAVFTAGARERRATWALDLQRSSLEALDDEARWLSSVDAGPAAPPADATLRLAAVREEVFDVDDAGRARRPGAGASPPVDLAARRAAQAGATPSDATGDDAGADGPEETGTGDEAAEQDRRERVSRTLDLLEALRGRRGRRQPLADPDDEAVEALTWAELEALSARVEVSDDHREDHRGDADGRGGGGPWDAAGDPPAAHPPASRPQDATDDEVLVPRPPAAGQEQPGEGDLEEPQRGRRRRRRAASRADDAGVPGQEELIPLPEAATEQAGADEQDDGAHEAGAQEDGGAEAAGRRRDGARRGARAGVPSWDDIVFGQRRD